MAPTSLLHFDSSTVSCFLPAAVRRSYLNSRFRSLADSQFRGDPAPALQAVEGGVQRAVLHLQDVVAVTLDVPGDLMTVGRAGHPASAERACPGCPGAASDALPRFRRHVDGRQSTIRPPRLIRRRCLIHARLQHVHRPTQVWSLVPRIIILRVAEVFEDLLAIGMGGILFQPAEQAVRLSEWSLSQSSRLALMTYSISKPSSRVTRRSSVSLRAFTSL